MRNNTDVRIRPLLKAIKDRCLDCCAGNKNEIKLCELTGCPLYPYRTGRIPSPKSTQKPQIKRRERFSAIPPCPPRETSSEPLKQRVSFDKKPKQGILIEGVRS